MEIKDLITLLHELTIVNLDVLFQGVSLDWRKWLIFYLVKENFFMRLEQILLVLVENLFIFYSVSFFSDVKQKRKDLLNFLLSLKFSQIFLWNGFFILNMIFVPR